MIKCHNVAKYWSYIIWEQIEFLNNCKEKSNIITSNFYFHLPVIGDSYIFPKAFPLDGLFPDVTSDCDEYFYYDGSLTVPDCNEVVQWIVYRNTITVSKKQVLIINKSLHSDLT